MLPLLIVVSIISSHPGGDTPAAFLGRRLGLAAGDVSSLQAAVAPPPTARASVGVLGVVAPVPSFEFGQQVEVAPLVLNGPPTVTGFAGGRPKVEEIIAYWPALIPKSEVAAKISVIEA